MKLRFFKRRPSETSEAEQALKLPPGFKSRIALTRAKPEDYERVKRDSYSPDGFARVTIVEDKEGYRYVVDDPKVSEETLYKAQRLIDEVLLYMVRPEDVEGDLERVFDALGIKGI